LGGMLSVIFAPFIIFYFLNMIFPAFMSDDEAH